jgi:hypothetical protein
MHNASLIDNVDLPLGTAYKFPHASPPLSIQYLAPYLKKHFPGELGEVRAISLPLTLLEKKDPLDAALELLRSKPYDLVGIRSLTNGRDFLEILTRAIKEKFPDIPLIVGAPYASDSPTLILTDHPRQAEPAMEMRASQDVGSPDCSRPSGT